MPLVLAAFGLAITLLFSVAVTLVLDSSFHAPPAAVLHTSFAARVDGTLPYASHSEMTVKPLRPLVATTALPSVSD